MAQLAIQIKSRDKRLDLVTRRFAQIIDDEYLYTDYDECHGKENIFRGIELLKIAAGVGSLSQLVDEPDGSNQRYALNMEAIRPNDKNAPYEDDTPGSLAEFLPQGFNHGLSQSNIIWAAALLWGGVSYRSQGYSRVHDRVLGIVAPHCTVVLQLVREPLLFAKYRLQGKMLSIHRGSVPILPRDPKSGYVHASQIARRVRPVELCCKDKDSQPPGRSPNDLIITFEPDILDGSMASLLCGWYAGELVFELDPIEVFSNLLIGRVDPTESTIPDERHGRFPINPLVRELGCLELIKQGHYLPKDGVVVFDTYSDPAWLIAGAGCVVRGQAILQMGPLDLRIEWEKGETIILFQEAAET